MRPITLRLQEELIEGLDEGAEQAGFSSRSEYIRYLLANRDSSNNFGTTSFASTTETPDDIGKQLNSFADRLDSVEARVATLEEESEAGQHHQGKPTSPSENTGNSSKGDTTEDEADSGAVFAALTHWLEENGPENETPRAILVDAARILADRGPLSAGELRDTLYEEHSNAYGSRQALWSATVARWYEDTRGFVKPERGVYVFDSDDLF